ncbi:MAG: deoxyribodipyrimidine photo-lyase [Gammaproteobacteria bacterium]|nr:deoxyribodipyrimidine photo-lyase [Gammaproteobacteria bacterium]
MRRGAYARRHVRPSDNERPDRGAARVVTLVWFRRDLRLADNPALVHALAAGRPIVPCFILDDADAGDRAPGGASRWWLDGSLAALARDLAARGSRLVLKRGPAERVLDALIAETGASAVVWNRRYEPWARARDERVTSRLEARGIEATSCNAALLREPWMLATRQGEPYRIFTPFRTALRARFEPTPPMPAPDRLPAPRRWPASETLASLCLLPDKPDWAGGLRAAWSPGETGARARLDAFLDGALLDYRERRDLPGTRGTSRLSPHLHFGEIGPKQIWHAVKTHALAETGDTDPPGAATFLSEIAWREFSYHLLHHFPALPDVPLRAGFEAFPWREDGAGERAWQRGLTGYPIVDAGMRELWATGWMHNRVRMIVASFLVKDLLVPWQRGERWFWDTLVDADLASNAASWQWVAGCGADAAPYFRIFNPALQGAKFDPRGEYVRRWVPELAKLRDAQIHAPWEAQPIELAEAGITLGRTYPQRIVDHRLARQRALDAFAKLGKT